MVIRSKGGTAIVVMATVALVLMSLIVPGSPALAVTNQDTTLNHPSTFYAYVAKGERMKITATGADTLRVVNEKGVAVSLSGGYTPTAGSNGVWQVTARGGFGSEGYQYDMSVRSGTTEKKGRIWVYTDVMYQRDVGDLNYFGVSDLGYIYQIKMHQTLGIYLSVALRSSGAAPNTQCNVESRSFENAYLDCGDNYRLFFEDPRTSGLPETANMAGETVSVLPGLVTSSQLRTDTKVAFTQNSDEVGGSFIVSSHPGFSGTADLQIDTNNNGLYTDAVDVEKTIVVNRGKSTAWAWDGKNASGAEVRGGGKARVVISKGGEAHLLVSDFEVFGGLTMTRLNGDSAPDSTIRWDDSKLTEARSGTRKSAITCLSGCNSNVAGGVHGWDRGPALPGDTESTSWGDGRTIDNWAYASVNATSPAITLPAVRTLNFDGNGGTVSGGSITRPHGSAWGTLPTATRVNNDFQGWFTAKTGGTKLAATTLATANLTAYAQWKPTDRTLTFDANGGAISGVTSITKPHGTAWGALPTATMANNDFQGWFTARTGGTKLAATTLATGNITAYAQWKLTPRILSFDANGGTINGVTSISKPHGSAWGTLPTASASNQDFLGWYTAKTGGTQVTASTVATGNITAYARWTPTPRTLTFDATGGTTNGASTITKPHGSPWGTLSTATLANNDFQGWFTAKTGGTKVTAATLATSNVTVYAQWKLTPRTLTFDANGGSINGASTITKPHGSPWGTLPTASQPAKVFLGWYTAKTGGAQVTASTVATANVTAYARWRPAKFNVVFYGNAQMGKVSGSTGSIVVDSGCTTCLLPANGFTKTTGAPELIDHDEETAEVNSKFLGWSLNPLSRTGDIADRAVAGNLSQTDGATVKLYAIWDDAPEFIITSYPDRFFNLREAKSGAITEAELLRTVEATDRETNPLVHKTSAQVQSSGSDVGVTLFDYDARDFTSMTASGVVTVTYKVKDEVGNVAFLRIRVTVSDDAPLEPDAVQYLRGISPGYASTGSGAGGLSEESVWRTDPNRQAALTEALDGSTTTKYCLDADAIAELRSQIGDHGMGNSETPDGLASSADVIREEGGCS